MSEFPDFYNYGYQVKKTLGQNYHSGRVTYQAIHLKTQQKVVIKLFQFAQYNRQNQLQIISFIEIERLLKSMPLEISRKVMYLLIF